MADIDKISIEIYTIDKTSQSIKKIQENLKKLQESLQKVSDDFTSVEKKAKSSSSEVEKASEQVKKYSNSAKDGSKTTNKFSTSLSNLGKRIGKMALLIAIRKTLMAIINAMKEGMDTFHQYAEATGQLNSTGAITVDKLKQLGAELKVTLGQTLVQILTTLYPLIQAVANAFNALIEMIGRTFAWINGAQWISGSKGIDSYVKSLNNAKKSLASFDEINNLNTNSSDSSSNYNDVGSQVTDMEQGLQKLHEILQAIAAYFYKDDGNNDGGITSKVKNLKSQVLELATALGLLNAAEQENSETNEETENSFEDLSKALDGLASSLKGLDPATISLKTSLEGLSVALSELDLALGNVEEKDGEVTNGLGELESAVANVETAYNNATSAITNYLSAVELLKNGNEENEEANLNTANSFDKITDSSLNTAYSLNFKYKPVVSETMSSILQDVQNKMGAADSTFAQATNDIGEATNNLANGVPSAFGEIASSISKTSENGAYQADKSYAEHFSNIQNNASKLETGLQSGNLNKSFAAKAIGIVAVSAYTIFKTMLKKFVPVLRFSGAFAKGGFPNVGDLFMCNEAGAELVGSMNGRTTVANQMEIIEGIKQGVIEAMQYSNGSVDGTNELLKQLINVVDNKSMNAYIDGDSIGRASVKYINKQSRLMGGSLI